MAQDYDLVANAPDAVRERCALGLIKQALVRAPAVKNGATDLDQREMLVVRKVLVTPPPLDGTYVAAVLLGLDLCGFLGTAPSTYTASTANIDAVLTTNQVALGGTTVWAFLIAQA